MEDRINTFSTDTEVAPGKAGTPERKKRFRGKGIIIFLAVLGAILVVGGLLSLFGKSNPVDTTDVPDDGKIKVNGDYIGELSVTDVISEYESTGVMSSSGYHHDWLLDRIDDMMSDSGNKGLILYVDTPGGSVYASDELYLKIKEYRETTGRPAVAYFASEAASGGYYISSNCDKIYANRNCWTGSIGVTLGTMYDFTELLDKYGVKTVTITSGRNKAMGSYTQKMTDEQRKILQSLVDEAYDQFVGIVAEGRSMDEKKVRELADGRIYTAKQALDEGLIDKVCTYEEAVEDMKAENKGLKNVSVKQITYKSEDGWISKQLNTVLSTLKRDQAASEIDAIKALMEDQSTFNVTYLSTVKKQAP